MADVVRHPTLGAQRSLPPNKQSAKLALESPRPTKSQAMMATKRTLAAWSQAQDDDYREAITAVFCHFPLAIVEECADPWSGIAKTKTTDGKPRRFPPSVGEVAAWLEARVDSCWIFTEPPPEQPPPLPPPNAENVARVQAIVRGIVERNTRVLGRQSEEDKRRRAETVLQRLDAEKRARVGGAQPHHDDLELWS